MRGKAFDPSLIILNKRITPAYAGKREFRRVQTLLHQDHPRLCGEKVIPPPELPPVPGSPPPMRGKVPHSFVHHLSTRITPAYAGKSLPKSWRNMTQKGSPPPMRGKEYRRYLRRNERGITPAYAGKSLLFSFYFALLYGSPPPMRGKVSRRVDKHNNLRITPAYAGKRAVGESRRNQSRDHPRLCGEKSICYDSTRPCLGSPPPMRGKAPVHLPSTTEIRITPAYAGKRYLSRIGDALMGDHPRLCGEK